MIEPTPDRQVPGRGPATSDLLASRYVLEEKVAVGGMAAVWRAHDEVLARTVAVKILHDDLARQEVIRERFRREAVAAAKLVHPAIVSLFDTGLDGDRVYLVIEFIDGPTLADALRDGPLDAAEVARIGTRITQALQHAHSKGIIHRDIKPANVLIARDGNVKVTDFGIAKAADDPRLTATGRVMGTAAYVAPEQLRGEDVDGGADMYSLGLVLYEALTGVQAFSGADPVAVAEARLHAGRLEARDQRADVPRALSEVIAGLTEPDRADRLVDPEEVIARLAPFTRQDEDLPPLLPDLDDDDAVSLSSEMRWLLPVAGLLLLAVALVAVGIFGGVIQRDRVASLFAEEVTPTPEAPDGADETPSDDQTAEATIPVPLTRLVAFDPQGDQSERDRFLDNLVDGAPSTAWATERYNTAEFGNLKEGVGFYGDLGGSRALSTVTMVLPEGGFDLELRVSQNADAALSAWRVVAEVEGIDPGEVQIDLPAGPQARYLMVWVTGALQPIEGQFRAEIGEIRVQALAS